MQPAGGGVPQTPGTPPPPQVCPVGQAALQVRVPPQPSPMVPQYCAPPDWQVSRMQPAGGGAPQIPASPPPPQLCPAGQVPQSMVLPQPSPTSPQYWPFGHWHITDMQPAIGGDPQTPGMRPATGADPQPPGMPPPPQLWPLGQPPQSRVLPQPSPTTPQYLPPAC